MKKRVAASIVIAGALLSPLSASAAQIKAYVAAFTVSAQEDAGLKETLQRLLSSRISGDEITTVGSQAEAEVVISGSLTRIGKVFSLDAVAKDASGRTVATAFEQGENQDEVIPALGRISAKLRSETGRKLAAPAQASATAAAPAAQTPAAAQALPAGSKVWRSQRIDGALSSIAPAGDLSGAKGYFTVQGQKLRLYRQEKTLKLVAETELPGSEKVLAVDSLQGPDGTVRAYLTIIENESPASRVYAYEQGGLRLVAGKLPYMFRAVALDGGPARLYAQQMGRNDDFFGDVYEVSEKAGKIELQNPIKLPRYANIFNFNRFSDAEGKSYFIAFSADGYLIVYSPSGEELWRSPEKFGGSETYFQRDAMATVRETDEKLRWVFLNQRITVTDQKQIIVPQNTGLFVLGNHRSYDKYTISGLEWNGSSLEERWKTNVVPNYLADYYYRPENKDLVLLEVVQKEGLFSKGGSAVQVITAQ